MKFFLLVLSAAFLTGLPATLVAQNVGTLNEQAKRVLPNGKATGEDPIATFSRAVLNQDGSIVLGVNGDAKLILNGTVQPSGRTPALNGRLVVTAASTITLVPGTASVLTLTPAQAETINLSTTGLPIGQRFTMVITTSGTSSYTLTFGTGFKTTGTLATGTTSAKVFAITFVYDGTNAVETGRTTAM